MMRYLFLHYIKKGFLLIVGFYLLLPLLSTTAQAQSELNKKVSIHIQSGSIYDALQYLEQHYSIHFSYSSDLINIDQKININQTEQELHFVLTALFEGKNIRFSEHDGVLILGPSNPLQKKQYTINGYIREEGSLELLPGASVYKPGYNIGANSNNYGFFSITLPADTHQLAFSYIGYKTIVKKLVLNKDIYLEILLTPSTTLNVIEIKSSKENKSEALSSIDFLDLNELNNTPRLLGEKDVFKSSQYLPGVSREHDLSNGYNIRGGTPDQNQIILDDATIYNPFHLFGSFSIFNGDALKNLQITKGGFPARYGGRLSSVIEMSTREGNKEKNHSEVNLGLLTSRLNLEGPIIKNKTSFFISARKTHLNNLIALSNISNEVGFKYSFYDLNLKLNHEFNAKDKIYLSLYRGNDLFTLNDDENSGLILNVAKQQWGNSTGSLRWNHLYNTKVFSNTAIIYSNFNLRSNQRSNDSNYESSYSFGSGIRDISIKQDFDYYLNINHHIKTGIHISNHRFIPENSYSLVYDSTEVYSANKQIFNALESAFYVEDEFQLNPQLLVNIGIRLSHFLYKQKTYFNPEPRLAMGWQISEKQTLKASYSHMVQYIHYIGNMFGLGLPNDLWLPSTNRIKPQKSNIFSLGYLQTVSPKFALTLESYYKKNYSISTYSPKFNFLDLLFPGNENIYNDWQDKLILGQGESYGAEFQAKKYGEVLSGWIAYSLSYTKLQFDELNNGKAFLASYDRRHSISIFLNANFNKHWGIQSAWIFATGNAISLPTSNYTVLGHEPGDLNFNIGYDNNSVFYFFTEYGERNSYRAAAYHKLDMNVTYHTAIKKSTLKVDMGVFNLYNRKNPLFYTVGSNSDGTKNVLKKWAFFGIMPSLSLTFTL